MAKKARKKSAAKARRVKRAGASQKVKTKRKAKAVTAQKSSGPIAVARHTQGISPKHCTSPAWRAKGFGHV
jgi:hypothetical protein